MKDVMAIGDNLNDLSMLEKVGYPVAMENGAEEVKKIAKYVTEDQLKMGLEKGLLKLSAI